MFIGDPINSALGLVVVVGTPALTFLMAAWLSIPGLIQFLQSYAQTKESKFEILEDANNHEGRSEYSKLRENNLCNVV